MSLLRTTLLILAASFVSVPRAAAQLEGPQPPPPAPPPSPLELFGKLTPQARFELIMKLPKPQAEFHTVARGDVALTIVERGTVEALDVSDLVCRLKSGAPGPVSSIKWVIEDGAMVKKDQKLLELDDAQLRERLKSQRIAVLQAKAGVAQAEAQLKAVQVENDVDQKLAAIAVRLAELDLKAFKGQDAEQKEVLALKLQKARLSLDRLALQSKARLAQAEAEVRVKQAIASQEVDRFRAAEEELRGAVLTAPRDGFVVHYVPEQGRVGGARAIVAVGEPVREGQKLLRVVDLKRMAVKTNVSESQISRVRAGQTAQVRVDAFPGKTLTAKVADVADTASPGPFGKIKVYPVVLHLAGETGRLKPGMSAEVKLEADRRGNVLFVPTSAVVVSGKDRSCFVKVGEEVQTRKITVGLVAEPVAEIQAGLKEGDEVVHSPYPLARRLLGAPKAPGPKADGKRP